MIEAQLFDDFDSMWFCFWWQLYELSVWAPSIPGFLGMLEPCVVRGSVGLVPGIGQ